MPVPTSSPTPTASTRRLSSMREAINCNPLRVAKAERYSNSAPVTGAGSSSQAPVMCGSSAAKNKKPAVQ